MCYVFVVFFFFQAEDGIRDIGVTGVQTCALPIYSRNGLIRANLYNGLVSFYKQTEKKNGCTCKG